MVQAAAGGVVDFSEADTLSTHWWTRLRLLLNELERRHQTQFCDILHRQALAAFQDARHVDATSAIKENWATAQSRLVDVARGWFPWLNLQAPDVKQAAVAMSNAWQTEYGDLSDPAVQEKIKRTAAKWMERRRKARERQGRR